MANMTSCWQLTNEEEPDGVPQVALDAPPPYNSVSAENAGMYMIIGVNAFSIHIFEMIRILNCIIIPPLPLSTPSTYFNVETFKHQNVQLRY